MTTLEASDFLVLILVGNKNILIPLMRSLVFRQNISVKQFQILRGIFYIRYFCRNRTLLFIFPTGLFIKTITLWNLLLRSEFKFFSKKNFMNLPHMFWNTKIKLSIISSEQTFSLNVRFTCN